MSTSKVWMKSRGTAGKPGGNRDNTPHSAAMIRTAGGAIPSDRHAAVSRGPRRQALCCRPERCPARGANERSSQLVTNQATAPGTPRELPLGHASRGEIQVGQPAEDAPVNGARLMDRVWAKGNLLRALRRVQRNGGSPGIDGMTVEELPTDLKEHWPAIREARLGGTDEPQPVQRVEIPQPDGGIRLLGVPTVRDRCIQQALWPVGQAEGGPHMLRCKLRVPPGMVSPSGPATGPVIRASRGWMGRSHGSGQGLRPGASRPTDEPGPRADFGPAGPQAHRPRPAGGGDDQSGVAPFDGGDTPRGGR